MADIHAMLDLETLGTGSNAFIVQMHIKQFSLDDPKFYGESFTQLVDPWRKQVGSEIDQSTVEWWQERPRDVREAVLSGKETLAGALQNLNYWLKSSGIKIDYLWANSPSFDCVILQNAFKRYGLEWKLPPYWAWRDMRTVVGLAKQLGADLPKLENTHCATLDVNNQIELLQKAFDFINQRG